MIDYVSILTVNYTGKTWSMNGNCYDGLEWLDVSPKPTQEELDSLWISTQEEVAKQKCKQQATSLLSATDWTQVADCPLVNKAEFTAYRATVRQLAINPVADAIFPELPSEQW